MTLRRLRWLLIAYTLFDICIGGYNGGLIPQSTAQAGTTIIIASGGIGVSCSAVAAATASNPGTAAGCNAFALLTSGSALPNVYTWQVTTTGSPTSIVVNFMGSLDGTTWIQLDTTTATGARTVNGGAYKYLGCVPATLSGGASPTITCQLTVSVGSSSSIASGVIGTGMPTSGNSTGQLFSDQLYISASSYCGAAGFGSYSATLASPGCTGSYDTAHNIGHGMCEAITQAMAALIASTSSNTPLVDARGFGGNQLFTSGCGTLMLYGGSAAVVGSTVDGKLQLGTVTILVDGPTSATVAPFFTDGALCGTTACTQSGTTSGPGTWGTPAIILPNQFTGIFGNGKDATQFIACFTTITGCVHDWPTRSFPITATSVAGNTMTITVTGTLLAGGQNGAGTNSSTVVTSFAGSSGTLSFTNSGTNAFYAGYIGTLFGFTAPNTGLNGQSCTISATGLATTTFQCPVTGSGYASGTGFISAGNIYPTGGGLTGEYVHVVGSSLDNNNGTYIAKTVPSSTTLTVQVPTGATSCAANCGTLWIGSPVIGWGMQVNNMAYIPQQGGAGLQSFAQRLEDLAIWGSITQVPQGKQGPYGVIAMQNANAGENAGAAHVQCNYIGFICLDAHGGATDSGPWTDLRMTNLSNNYAVRGTTAYAVSSAMRGVTHSSAIEPYPTGNVTTSTGAAGACAGFCAVVSGVSPATFASVLPNTQIVITGATCTPCTVASVQSNTTLTLTADPGAGGTKFFYGQPNACWMIDGQGPTVNQSPVFLMNHPEACADGYRLAGNYNVRGVTISGFLGGPSGGHADVNLIHAVGAGNTVLGSVVSGIDTQSGGATATVLDDINGNTVLDLPMNLYSWDPSGYPVYSAASGTFTNGINTMKGYVHSLAATQTITADTASPITATTAAGGISSGAGNGLTFTYTGFVANTTYKIHCSGTTTQATAGAGIGISFQTTGTATPIELHATVATGATATNSQSSGLVNSTTATALYTGIAGTLTTQLPWYIDGSIAVGATPPTSLKLGFFTVAGADAVTVKAGSTCDIR